MLKIRKSFLRVFKIAINEWINDDLTILVYIAKVTLATLLAMSISMYLNLSSPQTSIFTVFIVMQIHSGQVFSKSFFRFVGTALGFIVTLVLTAMFCQDRVWFIGFFSLWIAVCVAVGFKVRGFLSYGFVLSGYTVALIAFPNIDNPLNIYGAAVERISEVVVGLLCASIVSEVVFPKKLSNSLFFNEKQKYKDTYLSILDVNNIFLEDYSSHNLSKNVLEPDSLRLDSLFESNVTKKDKLYFQRLNSEFMHLSITSYSLRSIVNILSTHEKINEQLILDLKEIYEPIKLFLDGYLDKLEDDDLGNIVNEFENVKTKIKGIITQKKRYLRHYDFDLQNNFTSASHLILRLLDEFSQYTKTYLSFLNSKKSKIEDKEDFGQSVKFSTYTDSWLMLLTSFRAIVVVVATTFFWIITAWKFAIFAIILAVAQTLILSTLPNPVKSSMNFLKGAIISVFVAGAYDFYIIPTYVNDIPSFCFVLAPVFAFTAWLGLKIERKSFSFGFILIIISVCSMNLYYNMDFITYFETSIASLIGIMISGLGYELMNSWSQSWTKRRVSNLLTNSIIKLTNQDENMKRVVLESRGIDLIRHFSTQGRLDSTSGSLIFRWLLSSLEINRAIIDIKDRLKEFTSEKPKYVYVILEQIHEYFSQKDETKKEDIFLKLKDSFINLEQNRVYKSAIEQKNMNSILFEISLIYTVMLNKVSLPTKGEII